MENLNISENNKIFDIKEYMDCDKIRSKLINYPTELSLFELTCILINKAVNFSGK